MYSIENKVGRLVEAKLANPLLVEEVDACVVKVRSTLAQCRHGAIFCLDLTRIDVLAPENADKFLGMMRTNNAAVHRTGCLLPPENAILGLQVERLFRDAQHSARRAFRDVTSLEAWLVPVMTMLEAQQLRKFLASLG